jgi:hypothetical protein
MNLQSVVSNSEYSTTLLKVRTKISFREMTRGRIPPPRSAVLICRKNDEHSEALPDRICEPLVGTLSDAYLLQQERHIIDTLDFILLLLEIWKNTRCKYTISFSAAM